MKLIQCLLKIIGVKFKKKKTSIKRNVLLVEVVLLYHHNIELK